MILVFPKRLSAFESIKLEVAKQQMLKTKTVKLCKIGKATECETR